DVGSTFHVTLPLRGPCEQAAKERPLAGVEIAIVSPLANAAALYAAALTAAGATCRSFQRLEDAWETVESLQTQTAPCRQLVILDECAQSSWIEQLNEAEHAQRLTTLPLLALLPTNISETLMNRLNIAPERCVLKPVTSGELVSLVERWTAGLDEQRSGLPGTDACPRSLHILIADDAPVNQEVARGLLEYFGHTCEVADTGAEAVEAVQRTHFDAVLMDLEMPQMDGLEATAAIRALEGEMQHVPILAMTAHALSGIEQRCLAAGMDGCLTKPIQPELLRETLGRWAEQGPARPAADTPAGASSS
ncbi:MAG: response regulator, partial [Planctomycetales bacterium]|nr:response regulator [Planctomycetales bacterium]